MQPAALAAEKTADYSRDIPAHFHTPNESATTRPRRLRLVGAARTAVIRKIAFVLLFSLHIFALRIV